MKRDEIVCNCMGVTAGEIQDAIEAPQLWRRFRRQQEPGRSAEGVWRRFRRWWRSWLRAGTGNEFVREKTPFINSIGKNCLLY